MYKQLANGIHRLADNAHIPLDAGNSDYAAYLRWVAEGNTPLPAPVPSFEQLKAAELADFRAKREALLNRVAGIGFAAREAGDAVTVAAAVAYRADLLALPSHMTVTAATDLASLKLAIRNRYAEIKAAVPAAAKAQFDKVDQ